MSPTARIVDENIVGEVEVAAPPERVYAALTNPAELAACGVPMKVTGPSTGRVTFAWAASEIPRRRIK